MADRQAFQQVIKKGYQFTGPSVKIGRAMLDGEVVEDADIFLPLGTMNRHGLIAGATGTGKTKTLQLITECLSDNSIPVLLMDIKGDLSGLAAAGITNDKIEARCRQTGMAFRPQAYPVELLTLSGEKGLRLRATVSEFGPVLLGKILGLNDTQSGVVAMLFKYCDDHRMPLLNLKDFIRVLQFAGNEGKKELEKEYGKISTASTGTILRKVIELQQQGADQFFGEPSFDVADLVRMHDDGRGVVNILRVTDMQDRPKLFSTFMLQLLAELYATCPEEGDMERPKLVLFIDEAHLVFQEATEALLRQLETVIKLIRSKGIGIFFCTQHPQDIPASVLSQLGLKIQHALRAFTAADRKTIKQSAENFPETGFYVPDELLTQMGTGEALITLLNEKGIPTPLSHTLVACPGSRMDVLSDTEIDALTSRSRLASKYSTDIDSESAYEILTAKLREAEEKSAAGVPPVAGRPAKEDSIFDNPIVKQAGRTAAAVITRSLLGALGLGGTRRKSRGGW